MPGGFKLGFAMHLVINDIRWQIVHYNSQRIYYYALTTQWLFDVRQTVRWDSVQ